MKRNLFLILFSAASALTFPATAQLKIGYTNLEAVMAQMPEFKKAEQQLKVYYDQLSARVKSKTDYFRQQYEETEKLAQAGKLSENDLHARQAGLLKMEEDLKMANEDADSRLNSRRLELHEPVLTKLQNAINAVARAQGYTFILNQTTSTGVSTILYGPGENDITAALHRQLGLPAPVNPARNK